MPLGKHLINSRSLMEIDRYGNKYCFKTRSVAEHSWSVAKIAEGLAIWEKNKFKNQVDLALVLQKALNHDLIEQVTGDILGPTKNKTPEMKKAMEEIEKLAFHEEIEPNLPRSWREPFEKLILDPKSKDIEGQILRAADIIDTMFEAIEEITLGNNIFRKVLVDSSNLLIKVELESVKYFIKYAFNDFELDINEYYGEEFCAFREQLHYDQAVFDSN